jgi:hypothetical protein
VFTVAGFAGRAVVLAEAARGAAAASASAASIDTRTSHRVNVRSMWAH